MLFFINIIYVIICIIRAPKIKKRCWFPQRTFKLHNKYNNNGIMKEIHIGDIQPYQLLFFSKKVSKDSIERDTWAEF